MTGGTASAKALRYVMFVYLRHIKKASVAEQGERGEVGRRLGVARSSDVSGVLQAVMGLMIPPCRIRKPRLGEGQKQA